MKEKKPNVWHAMEADEVLSALHSDAHKGLTLKQFASRRRKCGDNAVWKVHRSSAAHTARGEFLDLSAILLLVTAIVSAAFDKKTEALVLTGILVFSATVRTVMFIAAQRIFEDAARANIPHAAVIRGGKCCTVTADDVVPGDILLFSAGDPVAADVRLLSGEVLVSETGVTENRRVQKKSSSCICAGEAVCEERDNILFAGTTVIGGAARGVVVATGEDTYIFAKRGYITVPAGEELSVLRSLSLWCRNVSLIMIAAVLIITLGGLFAEKSAFSLDDLFLSAVSLAVATMSEFLCVIAAIILAVSVQRLRTKSGGAAILRAADSMESFAKTKCVVFSNARLLQSDTVRLHSAYVKGTFLSDTEANADTAALRILALSLLCRCGSIRPLTDGVPVSAQDTYTEMIRKVYEQYTEEQRNSVSVAAVIAVNHSGFVHTILTASSEGTLAYVSGELEDILPFCSAVQGKDGIRSLKESERQALMEHAHFLAGQSIRTAAVAARVSPYNDLGRINAVQTKMVFVGFCAFINPVDTELAKMILKCRTGDLRLVVLTEEENGRLLAEKAGIISAQEPLLKTAQEVSDFVDENLSADSTSVRHSSGACVLISDRAMRSEVVQLISSRCPDTVFVSDALRDIPLFAHFAASAAAESAFRQAPQCLMSAADASVSNREAPGVSCAKQVMEIICACKNAFVHLRNAAEYLLTVQSFRLTLMCIAAFAGLPLHTPTQTLWWGLILDFFAVLTLAFSDSSSDSLQTHRQTLVFPSLKKGVVFPVMLGILSGVLLSLMSIYILQASSPDTALSFSYTGAILASFVLLLSVCLSGRQGQKRSLRLNMSMLIYGALFCTTLIFSFMPVDWLGACILCVFSAVPSTARMLYLKLIHGT